MATLKSNIYFKTGTIIIIGLLLLIPASMIKNMIYEREATQEQAIKEVSSKWGEEQTISGPFISIPYFKYLKQFSQKDSVEKTIQVKEFLHILPSELKISGKIKPERRYRGIYEIVVYNSLLTISGSFNKIKFSETDIPVKDIQFDKSVMTIGISDLRGIEEQLNLRWNDKQYSFNPGAVSNDVVASGINSMIDINSGDSSFYDFSFNINLKGSRLLYFTPVGKVTDITVSSLWNNPSFNGAFLPDSRNVSDTGFTANWNILHLNRNYPQMWSGSAYSIEESAFGIDLLLPVDSYQKSVRTIKYAVLFIGFTFMVFFFIEVLNKIFIHPVQYILVGIALIVFYTLLLSLSEHIRFNWAFLISGLSTLLLIAGYVKAVLKSNKLTFLLSGILLLLYAFIFVIIQLQDFALLLGSIGVFIILGTVMFISRKIDWYNITMKKGKE